MDEAQRLCDRVAILSRGRVVALDTPTNLIHGLDAETLEDAFMLLTGRTRPIMVEVTTLDHLCRELAVTPDAVMIDVEGFEIAVLRGASALLAGPTTVVVELHPDAWTVAGTDRTDIEQLLGDYRLQAVPLSGQADPLAEHGQVALEPIGA